MEKFHSVLSDESYQDARTNETHIHIVLQLIITKGFIASFLTTMWYHTGGFSKQYCYSYSIYILLCIPLDYLILLTYQLVNLYMENILLMV